MVLAWMLVFYEKYMEISRGYEVVLMHCAVVAIYFVEFYGLISMFDGTNDLRYE